MSRETSTVSHRGLLTDPRMLLVALIGFFAPFGNNAITPVLPVLATAFGVSNTSIALMVSVLTLPSVVFAPLAGILADMYGRRRILVLALSIFGTGGCAIVLTTSLPTALALRFVQGIGFAALMTLTITLLGDYYTGARASTAQGLRGSAAGLGNVIVPPFVGFLAGFTWQYPFLLFALAFPIALLVYSFLPESVDGTSDARASAEDLSAYLHDIGSEIRNPDLAVLMAGGVPRFLVMYALLTFVPLYAVQGLHATTFEAGVVIGARGVARMVIPPLSGKLIGTLSRKRSLLLGLAFGALGAVLIPLVPSVPFLVLAVGLYGVGDGIISPVLKSSVTAVPDDEHRAGVVSGMQILKDSAKTVSPIAFGLLLAVSSFRTLFFVVAGVFVAYMVVLTVVLSADL